MALMKAKEIPRDAVKMDEIEATAYVWDLVDNWRPMKDKWALQYGPYMLGGISAISGVLINRYFRHKLKLGTYGYFASVIPISILPGMMTAILHRHLVSTQILLMKTDACPICYEIRAVAVQLGMGVAYPMMLAPLTSLMLANRYSTARIPTLFEGPKVVLKFIFRMTKPFTSSMTTISAIHVIAAAFFSYFEMRNNFALRNKMAEIERKITAESGSSLE